MQDKELSLEDFFQEKRDGQVKEKQEFEKDIEKYDALLLKYRKELYNENLPELDRLFQLERIITQFIDLLNSDKYNTAHHNVTLEGTFTGFLEWKQRLSDRVISEYKELLVSVHHRTKQRLYYQSNNAPSPKIFQLSEDEKKLSLSARGPYKTKKTELLSLFVNEAMSEVFNSLKQKKEPNWPKIEKDIISKICDKGHAQSTVRGWFPAKKSDQRFDEIRQRVLKDYFPQ